MDALDRASELELKQRQMALSSHFKANQNSLVVSVLQCVECDSVIPEARHLAVQGCQYCVNCQGLAEQGKL